MTTKKKEQAKVVSQEQLADGIFSMWIQTEAAGSARPGQFISMYTNDGSKLLPRPISICEIDRKDGAIRLVYRVAGKGTAEFSGMRTGMQLKVVGPLGNGFPQKNKKYSDYGCRRKRLWFASIFFTSNNGSI